MFVNLNRSFLKYSRFDKICVQFLSLLRFVVTSLYKVQTFNFAL